MRIRGTTLAGLGVVALLGGAIVLSGVGCGDDDGDGPPVGPETIVFNGNIQEALGETQTGSADLESRWLAWVGPPRAIAQEEECDVELVLACAETDLQAESPTFNCSTVDPLTCTFVVDIVPDGDVGFFFVDDDGDGVFDPEEENRSNLINDLGETCAGQTITLRDVTVAFPPAGDGVATADSVQKNPETCPTPTPTPEPTSTPTPTPEAGDGDGDGAT